MLHLSFTNYCVCHEKRHLSFSKYCACHTEWLACLILVTYETSFTMRRATTVTIQTHQILHLPRKMTTQHLAEICGKQLKRHFQCAADPRPFRAWSENEPVSPQPAAQQRLLFALRTTILYWKIQRFALRLSFQISPSTAPATKSDTWPSPSTAPATKSDTGPSPSIAPATKSDTWPSPSIAPVAKSDTGPSPSIAPATKSDTGPSPSTAPVTKSDTGPSPSTAPATKSDTGPSPSTAPVTESNTWPSPSTAPATKSDTHAWSSSHMKRHLQCAETQMSPPKLTESRKMTTQHLAEICGKQLKRHFQCAADPRPFRAWSENEPVSPQPAAQQRLLFALRTTILYWKIQRFALRLSFQISPSTAPATKSDTRPSPSTAPATKSDTWPSPSTAPATKSDTWPSPSIVPATKSDTWPSPSTAPATKSDTWPSPSSAPATKSDTHAWSSSHMNRHLQCAETQMSPSKLTKYCTCHAKWPPNIWQKFAENSWNVISNARPIRDRSEHDPRMIREWTRQSATRRATEVFFSRSGRPFCIEKYNASRSGYLSKFHQVLRLPRKVTRDLHQVLHLPQKVKLELHQVLCLPQNVTLELHQILPLPRKVTLDLHQVLPLPRKVTLELYEVLCLPRKVTLASHQILHLPKK